MRLVFFGSPAFAVPSLQALIDAGHEIGLVVTQPDRPAGRGQKPTPPPVAAYANAHRLSVWQTSSLRGAEVEARLRAVDAEAMALAAFAALVPANILSLTPGGILNVHPSLLPRWRGAAPIQSALLAGDTETGVSIIRLVAALDAGPIFLQARVPIASDDDYVSLEPRLATLGAALLVRTLAEHPEPRQQDEAGVTLAPKIDREDARIDWSRPAEMIRNQVRAYRGWPQAFSTTADGRQLKVLRATVAPAPGSREAPGAGPDLAKHPSSASRASGPPGTFGMLGGAPLVTAGDGALRLDEVVLEGRRPVSGEEFLRGQPRLVGTLLGASVA
ncbi:MAG TPA: methionyl-tRNA formyltransferase [Chloroflexota bacterium]